MIFAGKKVLVFGTGKSGIAAEELLHKKGASVVLYDGNDKLEKEEILKKLESRDSVEVVLGELPEEMLDSLDIVVLSPGVPTDLPVVLKMKEKEIPVIGEVELAYQVSRGKVLAITGTNGKTTTTSLLGEIMKAYQPEVKVVGNIGTPYTSGNHQRVPSGGKCDHKHYRGSSEPPSHDGRVYPRERVYHRKSDDG